MIVYFVDIGAIVNNYCYF